MDTPKRNVDGIEKRLLQFGKSPIELTAAAVVCALLSGAMPLAHKNVESGAFHSQQGYDGFSIGGIFLFVMIAAFALAFLRRKRTDIDIPVKYVDYAAFTASLIVLVRAYSFLQSYEEENSYFFFSSFYSKTYASPTIGFLFLVAAPALLWWARTVERKWPASNPLTQYGDDPVP